MKITDLHIDGYHRVVKAEDAGSGLKAIIAIHNMNLGPAVGGTRLFPYSTEEEAMNDVLRLSKGMTYKSALADTGFGGGKSVIIAKPEDKTPELFKAFGKFVDSLGGEYICAEDVNTSPTDMEIVHSVTPHVLGLDGAGGDPSPLTALGVVESIWVTAAELGIKPADLSVTIQGIGHVVCAAPGGKDRLPIGIELTDRLRQVGRSDAGAVDSASDLVSAERFQVTELVQVECEHRPEKIR